MHKNEGYLGNINVKRAGVQSEWTEEQILEYQKCMGNPIYFIETYIKIISLDEGLVPFKLYEYQQELIDQAKTSMQRMRQAGQMKTVTETPSQRTERKDRERQERAAQREKDRAARAKEREEMRRGIMKASGGLVGGQNKLDKNKDGNISGADFAMMRKNYAYGGRVAKMSAEKS